MSENNKKYVISLDLSLSDTGICIFDENENPLDVFSVPTSSKLTRGERLKIIADVFISIKEKYNNSVIILEKGFTRFNTSTQAIFCVHGIANYVFYDKEQIYYAPSSIKKIVSGNGKTDKVGIMKIVKEKFPYLKIDNDDQSDAVSIGMAYFIDKRSK